MLSRLTVSRSEVSLTHAPPLAGYGGSRDSASAVNGQFTRQTSVRLRIVAGFYSKWL